MSPAVGSVSPPPASPQPPPPTASSPSGPVRPAPPTPANGGGDVGPTHPGFAAGYAMGPPQSYAKSGQAPQQPGYYVGQQQYGHRMPPSYGPYAGYSRPPMRPPTQYGYGPPHYGHPAWAGQVGPPMTAVTAPGIPAAGAPAMMAMPGQSMPKRALTPPPGAAGHPALRPASAVTAFNAARPQPGHPMGQSKGNFPPNNYPTAAAMYNGPSTGSSSGVYPNSSVPNSISNNNNNNNNNNSSSSSSSYGAMGGTSVVPPASTSGNVVNGPDALHDESSQQSTLSQSSDRSDGRQTPKATSSTGSSSGYTSGGNGAMMMPMGGYAPSSPHGSASPSHDNSSSAFGSQREITSPNWQHQRSPLPQMYHNSHQGFGSSISGDPSRIPSPSLSDTSKAIPKGTKAESLNRLYEMDAHPERRPFLDKLLTFMEQRGSPIQQCPTISKNPLDLFRLYVYTKEKGGYMECTKSKTWKDIAAQLGIGASSSGAYTLKKHYGKHLLPFECHFDRGGIDPAPLLAQVEAQTKKKSSKASNSVQPQPPPAPSPGSQDSRDSTSNYSGSNHNSQDAYSNFNYGSTAANQTQQPQSQTGYPHYGPGVMVSGSPKDPYDSYGARPWTGQGGLSFVRPNNGRAASPSESSARMPWTGPGTPVTSTNSIEAISRSTPTTVAYPATSAPPQSQPAGYGGSPQGYGGLQTYPQAGSNNVVGSVSASKPPMSTVGAAALVSKPNSMSGQVTLSSYAAYNRPAGNPQWQQMRYSGPPVYGGQMPPGSWRGPNTGVLNGSRPPAPAPWMDQQRQQFYGPQWGPSNAIMRPGVRPQYRPDPRAGPRPQGMGGGLRGIRNETIVFPPGSVEATQPLMVKRKRHSKLDVQPVEGWRIIMALKSGLLMESTWAIDVLNILLFDDNSVSYFGLSNMPGLLGLLLEHFQACLKAVFELDEDIADHSSTETVMQKSSKSEKKKRVFQNANDHQNDSEIGSSHARLLNLTTSKKRARFGNLADKDIEERVAATDDPMINADADETETNSRILDESVESSELWQHGACLDLQHIIPDLVPDPGIALGQKNTYSVRKTEDTVTKSETLEVKTESDNNGEQEDEEDIVSRVKRLTGIELSDPEAARRRFQSSRVQARLEEECHVSDEPSLHLVTEAQDQKGRRAVALSTILRNLSFVPGNEVELCRNPSLIRVLGQLLLHQHWHPRRLWGCSNNYERREDRQDDVDSECLSLKEPSTNEWWWDHLHPIRENVLVILTNVSGALDLSVFDEALSMPILDGLLEWAVSTSSYAQDPCVHNPCVSPQRLALESLCKLALSEHNADLLVTTPPYSRLERLMNLLVKKLYRFEDQVVRELSINLLFYLSSGDSGVSRVIATSDQSGVSLLLCFIEQAEHNAMLVAQQHGVNALRDNPDSMGTSLDMLRKAASTLEHLSRHPDNCTLFVQHEERLLNLVMSQILDQGVAAILANVLFNVGREQQHQQDEETR